MAQNDKIQLFENKRIRTAWDEEKEEWYFSIVDVVAVLTDQPDQRGAENTTVDDFIDHIDYVVRLVGIDHVGIGTDWPMPQTKWAAITFKKYVAPTIGFAPGNGPSTEWIHGLKDYRSFINVTRGLVARGYSDEAIRKILGENWLRVFEQVWKK